MYGCMVVRACSNMMAWLYDGWDPIVAGWSLRAYSFWRLYGISDVSQHLWLDYIGAVSHRWWGGTTLKLWAFICMYGEVYGILGKPLRFMLKLLC